MLFVLSNLYGLWRVNVILLCPNNIMLLSLFIDDVNIAGW